ncbi:cytochrome c oxidase subunit II [Actinocrinis sp.]|uniref:cytochrome c oxidase subunit II n=1 Tax=Actinocrinis sp. TaxID=1920516 RepID=UPI002D35946D|nr:cytochrome c oxidase subunit II [Actinocrinis sp.]HZP52736.1 cytochrome c oxidase subunit II [Actinocrinis sp.]
MDTQGVFGRVFGMESWIAIGVFVVVSGVVAFTSYWFRARPGREPSRRSKANKVELGYAAALLGFAIFLAVDTAGANGQEQQPVAAASAPLKVNVLALQWSWQFSYPEQHITVPPTQIGGRPVFVVPTGRDIDIALTSKDVVHEFWIPDLKYKIEAFPNHVNDFSLHVAKPGEWIGRCAVYCGQFHYQMEFLLEAVTPQQFAAWSSAHQGTVV